MIASVLVDVKHQAVDQQFDYRVPNHLASHIHVGQRVKIPFGPRMISGIVVELKEHSSIATLKDILAILDIEPLYSEEHIKLSETLAKRYIGITMSYLQAMIPNALRMQYQKRIKLLKPKQLPEELKPLFKQRKEIPIDKVQTSLDTINTLINKGVLTIETRYKQKLGIATEEYVFLKKEMPVTGVKQKAILNYLKDHNGILKSTLLNDTQSSSSTLNSLLEKDLISIQSREARRLTESLYQLPDQNIVLSDAQENVYHKVKGLLNTYHTFLLHGITSSGKTEVYIKLAETLLNQKKSVLVLIPEISLTPNLAARFKAKFKDQVVLYHSRLSDGERYDEWRKAKSQEAVIMIGARSAVFAPLNNLGLIIMDEEHSDAYRQDETPKYHAFEVAKHRAEYHQIPILLGSATPSIESYYYAKQKQYTLLELKTRALDSTLPTIDIIDMKEELHQGNTSMFSKKVMSAISKTLIQKKQTLILINRRGHANFVLCRECGKTVRCEECDLSMTYHHHDQTLKCHYCHTKEAVPKVCPHCQSKHIRYMGIGSERVEQELNHAFEEARIIRMDQDTTQQKNAHETILYTFEDQGDILVGTQMISKGLDFKNVSLVVILSADMALNIPDYYAHEEAFQLLMQMAGRSGRRHQQGRVILQSYLPDHPILQYLKNHDYQGFYEHEITSRKTLNMPPFTNVIQITIKHPYKNKTMTKTTEVLRYLRKVSKNETRLIGPITPKVARMQNLYRNQIIIKTNDEAYWVNQLHTLKHSIDFNSYTLSIDYRMTL